MHTTSLRGLLLASVCAMPAAAQDIPFESNAIFIGTVNLGAGDAINDKDITQDDLDRTNPVDLQDLFKGQPTLSVGSSIPASQKVYVNGVEETRLGVTIDGARQNNKIFHHNTTNLIDPALLKSVRVDPGVAPADAGPGALAGVIAFETKDVADLLPPGQNVGGRVKLEYGDNGDERSISGAGYFEYNGFEGLVFLKRATGDDKEDGDGDTILASGTDLSSGLIKFAYQSEGGHRVELSYENVIDDDVRPFRANIGRIIGGRPVPLTRTYDINRSNLVLTYTDESPEGWWDPKIQLSFAKTELNIPELDGEILYGRTQSFAGVFQNTFTVASGTITAGIDFFEDEAESKYKYPMFPDFDENPVEKLSNIGIFAQARLEPLDGLRLSFGARADRRELTGVDGSKHEDSGISANFAAEYDVSNAVTLSGGYSRVWGGIDLAENFIMSDFWTYDPDGFDAVIAHNAFLAAEANVGAWTFNAKVFETDINNARNAGYSSGPNPRVDLNVRGYELGVGYRWDNGFVQLAYANIDSDIDGRTADSFAGNYLTMPLGEKVTLSAMHSFEGTGFRIGGDVEYVPEYTRTYDYADGGRGPTLPSYTVTNIFADYTPPSMENLTLRVDINNLFDEKYAARATYGQEFVGEVEPLFEPGRTIRVSASIEF